MEEIRLGPPPQEIRLGPPPKVGAEVRLGPPDAIEDVESTTAGTLARGAERSVAPLATTLLGAELGAPLGPIGSLVGALAFGYGGGKLQSYLLSKLPESLKEKIGFGEKQLQADIEKHPTAAFLGEMIPQAAMFRPGWVGWKPAVYGGAISGGVELASQAKEGKYNINRLAMSTAAGVALQRRTAIAEKLGVGKALEKWGKEAGEGKPKAPEEHFDTTENPPAVNAMLAGQAAAGKIENLQDAIDMLHRLDERSMNMTISDFERRKDRVYSPLEELNKRREGAGSYDEVVKVVLLKDISQYSDEVTSNVMRLEELGVSAKEGTIERELQDKLRPFVSEEFKLQNRIRKEQGKGPIRVDPEDLVNYVPRTRLDARNWRQRFVEQYASGGVVGGMGGGPSMTDQSLKHREFFTFNGPNGEREVVHLPSRAGETQAYIMRNGKAVPIHVKRIIREDLLDKELAPLESELAKARRKLDDAALRVRSIPNREENLSDWNRALTKEREARNEYTRIEDEIASVKEKHDPSELHGSIYQIEGDQKPYKLWHATIDEIGQHAGIKYYENWAHNVIDQFFRLRAVERNIRFMKTITEHPEAHTIMADADKVLGESMKNWRPVPNIAALRNKVFRPDVANQLEDIGGKMFKSDTTRFLSAINNFLVRAIFYNPLPHVLNVFSHWLNERGLSAWTTPQGYARLTPSAKRAWQAVSTLNEDYLTFLSEGGQLLYGRTLANQAMQTIAKRMLPQAEKTPAWRALLGIPGMTTKKMYDLAARGLWMPTDVMAMQAVYENAERYGLSFRDAIYQTEKHIPNYRVPSEVAGSRLLSKLMTNTFYSSFGRYHYGVARSYAETVNAIYNAAENPHEARIAADQLAMLGVQLFFLYPMMDQFWQWLTGNPNAKQMRFGAERLPESIHEMVEGRRDPRFVIWELATPSPMARASVEAITQSDFLTRKPFVYSPYEIAKHLVTTQLAPLQVAGRLIEDKDTPTQALLRQLGVQIPSEKQVSNIEKWRKREQKAEAKRQSRLPEWLR